MYTLILLAPWLQLTTEEAVRSLPLYIFLTGLVGLIALANAVLIIHTIRTEKDSDVILGELMPGLMFFGLSFALTMWGICTISTVYQEGIALGLL